MKKTLWLWRIPVIAAFTFCFWVTESGVEGKLENDFFREKLYPALSRPVNTLLDLKFKLRGPKPAKNKIVIVDIDSPAIEVLGRWPWHRDVIAYLIEKAFLAGAKVVGLDILFSEADPRVPEGLKKILSENNLESVTHKFETDRILEGVIRRFSNRLVLGWVSELTCQPLYESAQFCPVSDANAISQFPADFDKFAFGQAPSVKAFDRTRTPIVSFVTPIANIPLYQSAAQHAGYLNAFLDSDGYIRRSSLMVFANGKPYPSLPLEMARVGLGEQLQVTLDETERLKSLKWLNSGKDISVTPLASLQVNFRGPSDSFPHIPALEVMGDEEFIVDQLNNKLTGMSKSELFKDAYVLIGLSAIGVYDMRQFPFESNAPGVDGHANILDNILSDDALIASASGKGTYVILMLMVFGVAIFAVLVSKLDAIPALAFFLATFVTLGFTDFHFLFKNNLNWNTAYLYLEFLTMFVLTLALKYIMEEQNKKFIRGAFAKYVSPTVVDSILKDPSKLSLGGEKRELTILFSDIRGFTSIAENMDAKTLASFLNEYLGIMTELVFSHQGTLDKYIGDAVMAFWGAPLEQGEHAWNACQTAIKMMQALDVHREKFRALYGIEVNIGIGINSGVVNVGNMGSEQTFEYTVIGDHVNLASRMEGLTKEYGAGILTTRFTFDSMQRSGKELPHHRVLDKVKVKGKGNAVELIQILENEYSGEGLKLFDQGRLLYAQQRWEEAIDAFTQSNRILMGDTLSNDGPCQLFIERCRLFQATPPASDWDGSWKMDTK